jgi:alkylation response protein AidB-like acyl-CoA dehydrogenase
LPDTVGFASQEFLCSANVSFGMYPGLTHGAYEAVKAHASKDLKNLYLPKMVAGEWSGTMCLTESHCGTDLGLIKTRPSRGRLIGRAQSYLSGGEHDLGASFIRTGKLYDSGGRGISLFLVRSSCRTRMASRPQRGAMQLIEHKMGIKASSTCVMNFDDATGWLIGEANQGMRAMFTMMNAARLGVGIQGLGVAEVARQNAVVYAKDRLQGRPLTGTKAPEKPADPIIVHPDVRKNLLEAKAFISGAPTGDGGSRSTPRAIIGAPARERRVIRRAAARHQGLHRHERRNRQDAADVRRPWLHPMGIEQFVRDAAFSCWRGRERRPGVGSS